MEKEAFDFRGEWEVELQVNRFRIFNNSEYNKGSNRPDKGLFKFQIIDELNANPDPEKHQINAINYLLNERNQSSILKNLLEYSKKTIYPHYKTFMWESEYPECYPKLEKVEDLNDLYGINRIIIKRIHHDDIAYYILDCKTCLDYEHGIKITLFRDTVIDHGEDWDDRKVCEHKGIDYHLYHEQEVKDYNHRELFLIKPDPKYGKLKPWQKRQNDYYPFGLFHSEKDHELMAGIEKGVIPKEPIVSKILGMAIDHEREDLTQYLIGKYPEKKFTGFKEALKKDRYDLTELLLKQNYDLNEKVAQSSIFYETIGFIATALAKGKEIDVFKRRLKYLLDNGLDPYLEDNFKRNSFFRIKRINDEALREKVEKEVFSVMESKLTFFDRMKNLVRKRKL